MEHVSPEVLVVDDEKQVRQYLATALRKNGFTVLEAPDGATAMSIIRAEETNIAAVVSDIVMHGIDGLKLAELNFQDGFRPFVVCTVVADAAIALEFLKFGVRDYVPKPVDEAVLLNAVRNAIGRRRLPRLFTDDETPFPGNLGIITIPARRAAIDRALDWLDMKASSIIIPVDERQKLLVFASEFLINAYEHGSLLLTEEKKAALLESGAYNDELRRLELKCKTKIEVAVSIVGNEIAISVTDAGYGFNYKRYQDMSESETLDRLNMPNGRGIQMAMHYFDSIAFSKGGAGVMFTKKMAK